MYSDVVIGTVHHICEVERRLQLHGLRALILDNAALLVRGPLHAILMAQLINNLRAVLPHYGKLNALCYLWHLTSGKSTLCCDTLLLCLCLKTSCFDFATFCPLKSLCKGMRKVGLRGLTTSQETFLLLCLTVYCGDILFCWRSVFIQATTECSIPLESVWRGNFKKV